MTPQQIAAMRQALEALKATLGTLTAANEQGVITDTIWFSEHETLFDSIASEIDALTAALEQAAQRCLLCNYQHGHAIGCKNNPVDIALNKMAENAPEPEQPAQQESIDGATLAGLHASISILSRLVDQQRRLLVEVEDICGRDGHGGRLEDGESELIDKVRANLAAIAEPEQQDFSDAYQGAREDLAIWKKRALEAEALNRKFIAEINGPIFMGEPAQQEPVAWVNQANLNSAAIQRNRGGQGDTHTWSETPNAYHPVPLYTRPQAREPLTDEQIDKLPWGPHEGNPMTFAEGLRDFARAIEAAHGIKGDA